VIEPRHHRHVVAALFGFSLICASGAMANLPTVDLSPLPPPVRQAIETADADANAPALRQGLAFVALAQGRFEEAEQAFAELSGDDDDLRYWQAMAQLGQGQCAAPEALLSAQLTQQRTLDPAVMDALARIRASCGEAGADALHEARNWAEALYEAHPNIDSAATLAMVMAALGRFDDAEDFQGQALFEALRDGQLDARPDLVEDMGRYRQQQRAQQPYAPSHPVFQRAGL